MIVTHHGLLKIKRLCGIPAMHFYRRRGIISTEIRFDIEKTENIALVAAFPTNDRMYLISLENLLSGLKQNSYEVIFVSNSAITSAVKDLLLKFNCGVILRKNIGRDFGAYQAGMYFLKETLKQHQLQRVLLVNDTLLWFDDSSTIVSKSFETPWNCLYFNLEYKSHAQSFYMSFSEEVLNNRSFINFWHRYVPLNSRIHAISFGEHKLTTKLLDEGFTCKPYVDSSLFAQEPSINSQDFQTLLDIEVVDLVRWKEVPSAATASANLTSKLPFDPRAQFLGTRHILYSELEIDSTLAEIRSFIFSDGPHRVGLHLAILFGVPIKMDLYKCYNIRDILRCLSICNSEIVEYAADYFLAKSQHFKSGSRKKIKMRQLGEI